ncbi:hypothetical protein D910_02848 [Dendroctonus ponderosae]|uniref:Bee-milk protein n=2 Tax=Dendroctonus ponderosae TaxID=77166 RepID=U4TZI4_DENPD|nr:hypothetical protein D910_02848 [Dendroctonus ponderosae]KAH1026058.1 hypothetical protein HUJ05_010646 [Dendroctonus ponderosae]
MRADPRAAYFRVNDVSISASLNIASLALSPRIKNSNDKIIVNDEREVFYSPLSSLHLYSINSSVLKNEQFAATLGEFQGNVKDYGTKASQSVGMVMDNQGVLYYSLLALNGIARWDSGTPFQTGQKMIAKDERYLEWVNSFAFDDQGNLTILVNRLNRFIYQKLSINEPNFRLIASNVGGKSYLYDESYNYESSQTSEASSTTTTEKEVPVLKPGTDQDPYLSPQPAEPQAEPTPESSMGQTNGSTTPKPSSAAAEKAATALISLLIAGMLLVV